MVWQLISQNMLDKWFINEVICQMNDMNSNSKNYFPRKADNIFKKSISDEMLHKNTEMFVVFL